MKPRLEDLHIKLLDLETGDVLPDAVVSYQYVELGTKKTDSVKANASGIATLPQKRYCSIIKEIKASCYSYADTIRTDIPCNQIVVATDSSAMRLRPIKQRFTFFVKNKESKQPIPDATCTVTLRHHSGRVDRRVIHTSIDGKGIAVYPDAFVLATIAIRVSKIHYKEGNLNSGKWTVENFVKQKNDVRTVWLEPEPYLVEFQNIDSLNGRPISGVKNVIKITDIAGKSTTIEEISNSNGVFPVTAKEGSHIEFVSTKSPEYKQKETLIPKFKDKQKIKMMPNVVTLQFRTVKATTNNPILPQCSLRIVGTESGSLNPNNSGSGSFETQARLNENLTIIASKSGFTTNSTTVSNVPVANLRNGRDIPLKPEPVVYQNNQRNKGTARDCYDLKDYPVEFLFEWKLCDVCTMLIVTDANGNIIGRFGRNSPGGDGIGQQYSPPVGNRILKSSTQTICVTRTDVNGDECWYRISKK